MNFIGPKDERYENAAARLIGAARLTESEIDKIASAPQLFVSIRTRIAEEQIASLTTAPATKFRLRGAVPAFATMLVAAVAFGAFMLSRREAPQLAVRPKAAQLQRVETPQEEPKYAVSPVPDREFKTSDLPQAEHAIVKEFVRRQPARKGTKPRVDPQEKDIEFYALNAAAYDTREGRIVRVNLPRASLVALGANISLESDRQNITADILVGADGVPRAIRVVQ